MISSLLLCILMSFLIIFFVVMTNNFSIASIIYALFLIFLFTRMTFAERKKKGSGVVYRRIFQTVFAVGFIISIILKTAFIRSLKPRICVVITRG